MSSIGVLVKPPQGAVKPPLGAGQTPPGANAPTHVIRWVELNRAATVRERSFAQQTGPLPDGRVAHLLWRWGRR